MDFSKLVEVFDRAGVTFVSVTQSFNTTTSMGRLTLNILLSFAQFEREVIAERVRDKIRASRQKGMWMGGSVPLGYVVKDRKLVVHEPDAAVVRSMFERFLRVGSATVLAQELRAEGVLTTKGRPIDKGYLYKCLSNRTYLGLAIHKGTAYPGEHAPIISQDLWDKVHAILAENGRTRSARTRAQTPALLKGLIFGPTGAAMSPTHTRKGNRLYRYYVSQDVLQQRTRCVPDRAGAGGRDRGRGHRPAARHLPAAGDHRRHLARRACRAGRHHRGRGAAGAHPARSALGRAVPGRAGADRAAPGRAGGCAHRRRLPAAAGRRPLEPGAAECRRQQPGGSMNGMTVVHAKPCTVRAADDLMAAVAGRRFRTILADPPWRFQNRTGKVAPEHRRLRRYDTMALEEIAGAADRRPRRGARRISTCGFRTRCCRKGSR